MFNKAIFLDRDGVLNEERGQYTFLVEHFHVVPGIIPTLRKLKQRGYLLIVITNQAGIAKGLCTRLQVDQCHQEFQRLSNHLIDHFYIAPDHPEISASLSRKPDSLLFEKAMARYDIDPSGSWMVGDKERDLIPAKKMGINTILIGDQPSRFFDYRITEPGELIHIIC